MEDLNLIVSTAKDAATKAGYAALTLFEHSKSWEKSMNNMVTDADIEAEKIIINMLRIRYPNIAILSEENNNTTPLNSDKLWIIDPLDGTNNFSSGIPHFAVSIAYAEQSQVLAGVVFDPVRKELFHSIFGKGSFLNGESIHVTKNKSLNKSIIATGFYYDRGAMMEATLTAIKELMYKNIRGIRRMGSSVLDLCWTACARYDAFFEYNLSPWDFAAGSLIVKEAGGQLSDRSGQALELKSKGIIATGGVPIKDLLNIVQW